MNLFATVGLVHETVVANTTCDLLLKLLWQIHGVSDRNHKEPRVGVARPVEEVVQQGLLLSHKGVQFVDQNDAELLGLAL